MLSAPINLLLLQRDINSRPQTSEKSVAVCSLKGRTQLLVAVRTPTLLSDT